ncbi:MAG: hypothetical protein H6736_23675 [Alphaproteobacteria bacterium]|nr:hypothetical protein [Alphaproteobacteria bacterium]MCB9694821.1 hypothetical protein [Alphaproteobacteria bacterium]
MALVILLACVHNPASQIPYGATSVSVDFGRTVVDPEGLDVVVRDLGPRVVPRAKVGVRTLDDRVEIVRFVTVVEVVEDPITQLDLDHARLFAPRAKVGETIAVALTFGPFLQAGLAEDDRWYRGRRKGD